MIKIKAFGSCLCGLLLSVACTSAVAQTAEQKRSDPRFYIAPAATYDYLDQDTVLDDDAGWRFSAGVPLFDYFNLELNAFRTEADVKPNQSVNGVLATEGGSIEGIGANLLFFPARYHMPFFVVLSASAGEFESAGAADDSADVWEAGFGYIHPLTQRGGISLRMEYRFRNTAIADDRGDDFEVHDHVVSVGLQVPIGARRSDQLTRPSDWRNPEPPKPYVAPIASPPPVVGDDDRDGVKNPDDECPDTPFGAAVLDNGCSLQTNVALELRGVNFAFNSDRLTPESFAILNQAADVLRRTPGVRVQVAGHTDNKGSAEYNLQLSQRRTESVRRYLISKGIAPDRLEARGYGEHRPLVSNYKRDGSDDPAGRARNRRVEFWVIR